MKKFFAVIFFISACFFSSLAFAADVDVWRDPSLRISDLKKIFVMPANLRLNAGRHLVPPKQLSSNAFSWTVDGINAAAKKGRRPLVKNLDNVLTDMRFIYGENISVGDKLFFDRAAEMGYAAYLTMTVNQQFETEHVPEQVRTYTVYHDIEKRDHKGRLIETIRIPEEKTEVIPAHDVTYLYTTCEPRLYLTQSMGDDYSGAASCQIYREYQGGPVIKVVENIIKASVRELMKGN